MLMSSADTLMLSGVSDEAVSAVGVASQFIFIAVLIIGVINNGADEWTRGIIMFFRWRSRAWENKALVGAAAASWPGAAAEAG